jgi:hypothetical protein
MSFLKVPARHCGLFLSRRLIVRFEKAGVNRRHVKIDALILVVSSHPGKS